MLKEYLQNNILVTDGAIGTYYCQLTGKDSDAVEMANIYEPELVKRIHSEYIKAGARLIRTNTFAANCAALGQSRNEVKRLLIAGYKLAVEAAQDSGVYVAANIGPIPETVFGQADVDRQHIIEEYRFLVDTFLAAGAEIFNFETFSSVDELGEITRYVKEQNPAAFVLTQFALTPDGFTRKGIGGERIVAAVKSLTSIDAYGFNCGVGPTHLYNLLKRLDLGKDIVAVLPNAGYPEIVNERTIYRYNPDYFAGVMQNISALGVKILGGCCGTTPAHIKKLVEVLAQPAQSQVIPATEQKRPAVHRQDSQNSFADKLKAGKFVIAVELDPPFDTGIDKILQGAWTCKENGVDIVTIADSPMGRARADSVMLAARIKREVGIEAMPHICCRDRNLNALKSSLIAGHIEGIRNILAVTGDPVAKLDKAEIKGVFNVSSIRLMELIMAMNQEVFTGQPYAVGGALNLNIVNKQVELDRMVKKAVAGAQYFLTQPIFAQEVIDFLPKVNRPDGSKVLGGIMPLVSYNNAQFLNNEVPGIQVPEEYIERFDKNMTRQEAEAVGIALAVELAHKVRPHVDGFYFITPFNRIEMIVKIINQCRER